MHLKRKKRRSNLRRRELSQERFTESLIRNSIATRELHQQLTRTLIQNEELKAVLENEIDQVVRIHKNRVHNTVTVGVELTVDLAEYKASKSDLCTLFGRSIAKRLRKYLSEQ